jgi:putative addiction module component (TIGR02574 family)
MSAAKLLAEALQLPEAEREELAATLLDSLEHPPGLSIEDRDEIERRAEEARGGAPGIPWEEVKRSLPR